MGKKIHQKNVDSNYMDKEYKRLTKSYKIIRARRIARLDNKKTIFGILKNIYGRINYQFLSHYPARPPIWRLFLRKLNGNRPLPDFAIVGPIKSGTSDLVTHLLLHPNIIEPFAKEIFSPNPMDWKVFYPTVKQRAKINKKKGKSISGFLGPFMHSIRLIDQYHKYSPNAKIVILLRDPVARAYSHYKWDLFLGGKRVDQLDYYSDFSEYINTAIDIFPALEMDTICGFGLLETGIYYKAVERWLKRFGKENVLIINVANYFKDREVTFTQIQEFLGVPIYNLDIKKTPLNPNPLKVPPMCETTKAKLKEFYKPYNKKLYKLLDEDFNW